jgi:hypothetical protein
LRLVERDPPRADVRVFLSYRRDDVGGHAGRLADALATRLGRRKVFHDVTAIRPGRDFRAAIDEALASCDAVLAVIGPGWLEAATDDGRRRLSQDDDVLRQELSAALHRQVPVVPVLVGGARLPKAEELPADLTALSRRQAVVVAPETFHTDVDVLLRALRSGAVEPSRRWRRLTAGGLVVAVLAGVGAWRWYGDSSDQGLTGCPDTRAGGWTRVALASRPAAVLDVPQGEIEIAVNSAHWRTAGQDQWELVLAAEMGNRTTNGRRHERGLYGNLIVARRAFAATCFDVPDGRSTAPYQVSDAHIGFLLTCVPQGFMELELLTPTTDTPTALALTAATTPSDCRSASS